MMSKRMKSALAAVLAIAFVLAGCVSQKPAPVPPAAPEATTAASATQGSWSVELSGVRKDSLNEAYYRKIKAAG